MILLLAICVSCDQLPVSPPESPPEVEESRATPHRAEALRPNVLLYVVDTLRADHLGTYGNETIRTPQLDRFAQSGVVFTNAYANSTWTRPSMASLLTGLYPTRHATNTRGAALPPDLQTLAERLAEAGWQTAFITANPNVGSAFGFERGFDSMQEMYARREPGEVTESELVTSSNVVTKRALAWIDRAERPFFLVCLSIDPHQPLRPPARFDVYGKGRLDFDEIVRRQDEGRMTPELFDRILALYRAEVTFNDDSFGKLMSGLRARGLVRDTLVVFTADHGEEFGEYGRVGHGLSLADPVLRVPLIVSLPSSERINGGERIDETVELVDVVPSILDLVGLPNPGDLDGQSLFGSDTPARPALSTLRLRKKNLRAAVSPPWKLVHDISSDRWDLYDLHVGEAKDAGVAGNKKVRARLESALARLGKERPISPANPETEIPARTLEALRALGYTE